MMQSAAQEFQVGDRVVAVIDFPQDNCSIQNGEDGVVCDIDEDGMIGVDWEFDVIGHSCSGHCKKGYGWYVYPSEIKLFDADVDVDEDSFLQIIGGTN